MENKKENTDLPYQYREDNDRSPQTGNINERNNNVNNDTPPAAGAPNVENANDTGIGDAGQNDEKLTKYTSNHSADA